MDSKSYKDPPNLFEINKYNEYFQFENLEFNKILLS